MHARCLLICGVLCLGACTADSTGTAAPATDYKATMSVEQDCASLAGVKQTVLQVSTCVNSDDRLTKL